MFKQQATLEDLNRMTKNTLMETLGIEMIEIGADYITAKMPVDKKNHQPMGLLHGGASVALAESLGSVAGFLCLDNPSKQQIVGVEINANHVRSVRSGFVYGRVCALHVGKKTHVWEIKITNEENKLVCVSRITVAVIDLA